MPVAAFVPKPLGDAGRRPDAATTVEPAGGIAFKALPEPEDEARAV